MLLALSLRDFVLVDTLNLNFQPGFTVLTGETGAGKSITLDALGLLLGNKADYGQIRHGAAEAQLSALFDVADLPELRADLQEQGLLAADDTELSIRRVIDVKGKSRSFINNQAATLSQLKQIGGQLIDIHGQNEHQRLGSEAAQRELLDAFAAAAPEAAAVRQSWQAWQQAQQQWEAARNQADTLALERERLQWQFDELSALGLHTGEWEEISHSHDLLAHAAELMQAAEAVGEIVDGDDGLQSQVYRCQQWLQPLLKVAPQFADSLALLDSIEAELSEVSANMRTAVAHVEMDENLLAQQEERLQTLMSTARKYRIEPAELPGKQQEIEHALAELAAAADLDALAANTAKAEAAYHTAAAALSAKRSSAAQRLAAETAAHMQELAMRGAQFHIQLSPAAPSVHGTEQVQYQVAANKGSPLRAMSKVASGGELARISLALQMVTSQYTAVPMLIFDEVDSGIGGAVAEVVGKALRALGQERQVLAITHLPQVAACGEQHWQVQKSSTENSTVSRISVLDEVARIDEIARMLGGETITTTTREHAREMLGLARAV